MIHCIGDSHVLVFSGVDKNTDGWPCPLDCLPHFRSYRIGPYLAHSLGNPEHRAYQTLMGVLGMVPYSDTVLVSFGEIDCRVHIVKQAKLQNRTIEDIVREVVENYSRAIIKIREVYKKVIVYAPVASCNHYDPEADISEENPYPHIGKPEERNLATKLFSDILKRTFSLSDILVVSVFDRLVDDKLVADMSYYRDCVHLSQKAIPLIYEAINEESLAKWADKII